MAQISSTSSAAHRTCPACGTVVRPNQVRVRRHHGTFICLALVVPAGALGYFIAYKLGLFDDRPHRSGQGIAVLAMMPFFWFAWRLPHVRVVRCPNCKVERTERLSS